jgi:hypothetical protein
VHSLRSIEALCEALDARSGATADPKRWLAAA